MSYTFDEMRIISAEHAEVAVERVRWWHFLQGFATGAGLAAGIYWYFF